MAVILFAIIGILVGLVFTVPVLIVLSVIAVLAIFIYWPRKNLGLQGLIGLNYVLFAGAFLICMWLTAVTSLGWWPVLFKNIHIFR